MKRIVTLTLNPTVDKSTAVDKIVPDQKLRCETPKYEPGGGGINVSRALKRLGSDSTALFPAGGATGQRLQELLREEGLEPHAVPAAGWTRENFIVVDSSAGQQYRFGMPGTPLTAAEQQQVLAALRALPTPDFLVVSGSLPPGVEPEFLVDIVRWAHSIGAKVVADTSGPALQRVIEAGVYLIKPNVGELSKLAGVEELDSAGLADAAQGLIGEGRCEIVVTSLGPQGACVVTRDLVDHIPAPAVKKRSTVGAGDSMVAGLVHALAQGQGVREAARLGVACGTAATMNPGTELFKKADVDKLYQWLLDTMPQDRAAA
ncbi:1-phosphofructokinase family hexose kinase [Hymenobacter sp. 15J16-1T3B]|uniref:1-phosphofructokinase family hexose kinase n=1 Tax=Hymenobacter sp. 15J16-1T3B TaxID=2886941 RepID=UPI001D0F89FE|nr:1-phosphofructokinase family hexose kinase [Hymenobacter sp. 15J16-1T3B]MCC3157998.1 1-phosphofructokinase family hexose kinase [Hymenobacter sp. 15J16-1T3B]